MFTFSTYGNFVHIFGWNFVIDQPRVAQSKIELKSIWLIEKQKNWSHVRLKTLNIASKTARIVELRRQKPISRFYRYHFVVFVFQMVSLFAELFISLLRWFFVRMDSMCTRQIQRSFSWTSQLVYTYYIYIIQVMVVCVSICPYMCAMFPLHPYVHYVSCLCYSRFSHFICLFLYSFYSV